MSTPISISTTPLPFEYRDFLESLPTFPRLKDLRLETTLLHNHILVSYFSDDEEIHSAKFYTACLTEPDVVSKFIDQLEEDTDDAHSEKILRDFFASVKPTPTKDPIYVFNAQPFIDAAPNVPGLIKSYSRDAHSDDVELIYVDYKLSDGTRITQFGFTSDELAEIYAGTYVPTEDLAQEEFVTALSGVLAHMEATGSILRKDSLV